MACLASSVRLVVGTLSPSDELPDARQRSGERFAKLREVLPARGVVGYIGPPQSSALGYYYLTQYALAPVVVDSSTAHPLVIGNFPNSPPQGVPANLTLVRDFGDGLLLFANNKDAR